MISIFEKRSGQARNNYDADTRPQNGKKPVRNAALRLPNQTAHKTHPRRPARQGWGQETQRSPSFSSHAKGELSSDPTIHSRHPPCSHLLPFFGWLPPNLLFQSGGVWLRSGARHGGSVRGFGGKTFSSSSPFLFVWLLDSGLAQGVIENSDPPLRCIRGFRWPRLPLPSPAPRPSYSSI